MEYKKSYKGVLLWFLFFIAAFGAMFLIKVPDPNILLRFSLNICSIGVAILSFIIYKTESIYWLNGVEFEEAKKAGSDRRKAFALAYFKTFLVSAVLIAIFSIVMQILSLDPWIDFSIGTIALIAAAISTVRIKL